MNNNTTGSITIDTIMTAMRIINRTKPMLQSSEYVKKGKTIVIDKKYLRDEYYKDLPDGFQQHDESLGREMHSTTDKLIICHPDDVFQLQSVIDEEYRTF